MAIIDFNSSIWSKPWFRKLPPTAKILFVYLWTNNHKNLIGMYEIDFDTIQFETGLNKKQITDTLSILYPKVKYDINKEIVWVVNHVRHQFMRTANISPKIIAGIEKCLISLKNHSFVNEFLENYNTLSIGYQYPPGEGVGVECIGEGEEEGKANPPIQKEDEITYNDIVQGWNTICATKGFPKVSKLTPDRKSKINTRLKTHTEVEFWNKVFNKIVQTPFLMGKNDRKWKPTFDWLMSNDENSTKIYEGNYDQER